MGWTDERVDSLRQLWLDGLSASQIAKQLGGVTRNAVIGKVHRLGLSGRAPPSQPHRQPVKPARLPRPAANTTAAGPLRRAVEPAPIAPVAAAPSPPPVQPRVAVAVVRAEAAGSATVLTLGAHMCKWPIGDPGAADFGFCGRRSSEEGPYCREHADVAYQPAPRRPAKRNDGSDLARSLRRYI